MLPSCCFQILTMSLVNHLALVYPKILLSLACFFVLLLLSRRRHGRIVPRSWPLLGMFPDLLLELHHFHDWVTDLLRETGCTFRFRGPWFCGMDILCSCDPDNISHIFNSNFANYPKGAEFAEVFDLFGGAFITRDGESWKSQRKAAHIRLSDARFRRFVASVASGKVDKGLLPVLLRSAEQASVVDLQDVFLRYALDTTSNLVFGVDPGSLSPGLPTVPFAQAMDDAEDVMFFRHSVPRVWWKLLRWLRAGKEKKMALALEVIDDFVGSTISKRMEKLREVREDKGPSGIAAGDLLTSYLDPRHEVRDDSTVDYKKFLRDTMLNFMIAARDTSGVALTWFFWLVSQHPHVEQKILDELTAALKKKPEGHRQTSVLFEADDLSSAVYLQAALNESLRLFPPVPFEHRSVLKPDVLPSGHRVDAKTKIIFSVFSIGRIEGIWGRDCCEFKPERWIDENGRVKHEPSHKFFTFASGPRVCVGKDMALTLMRVLAATMIYKFRIKPVQGHVAAPKLSIILNMKNGLMVRVEKREAETL